MLVDLAAVTVDLDVSLKRDTGVSFDMLTPSEHFIGKKFNQNFDGRRWVAFVKSFTTDKTASGLQDTFTLHYNNGEKMEMQKAELVSHMSRATDKMRADPRFAMRADLLDYRFVRFSCFMLDLYAVLAELSCQLQSNSINIFTMQRSINKCITRILDLVNAPGIYECEFIAECARNGNANVYKLCHLTNCEVGLLHSSTDAHDACKFMATHLEARFTEVLNKPEIHAFAAFDHRKWPCVNPEEGLEKFGKAEARRPCTPIHAPP